MLRSFGISALVLGSVLALAQPQVASARDRDDYRRDRDRREDRHRREEWREHERWEHRYARPIYGDPRYGFFDRFGYWHWY
jgi:hypothetical protein